jgi:hypothetical protein
MLAFRNNNISTSALDIPTYNLLPTYGGDVTCYCCANLDLKITGKYVKINHLMSRVVSGTI